MERSNFTPYHGAEAEGTYPEPDHIPVYPWLGRKEQGGRPLSPTLPTRESCPMLAKGFSQQNHDSEVGRLGLAINDTVDQDSFLPSRLRQPDDPAVDPDFELSEGSRMCV